MSKILETDTLKKYIIVFFSVLFGHILISLIVSQVSLDITEYFHQHIDSSSFFIEFAPEVWLTLMSVVLGTLIIVISIASQSNPKLIDYYIGDYPSLFYTCGITFSGIQNVYLQLNLSVDSLFWKNLIFVNAYVFLPLAILNVIPYSFYILSYTKTSSLIRTIFRRNKNSLLRLESVNRKDKIEKLQFRLLDTINQLDDQLGFVAFKEPKSEIIRALGSLLRHNLINKHKFNPNAFKVSKTVADDISFKTLSDKFGEIEKNNTYYEHKIFRVYSGIYTQLIDQGHHDLASQCAYELSHIGMVAAQTNNLKVLDLVIMQFNTFLRFGIKHATHSKDIRNVYNCVFHYTHLIVYFIKNGNGKLALKVCEYLTYYGREVYKMSFSENYFNFLIDCFASEVQRILIECHQSGVSEDTQMEILKIYANLEPDIDEESQLKRVRNNTSRSIKIALILFYLDKGEHKFAMQLVEDIIYDLRYFDAQEIHRLIKKDCDFLNTSGSVFWEYTDRGDKNIYFTSHKEHIKTFWKLFRKTYYEIKIHKQNADQAA